MPSAGSPTASAGPPLSSAAKPFSLSLNSRKTPTTSSSLPKKRPHSTLAHHSDSEGEESHNSKAQLVSSFDHSAGGAISSSGPPVETTPLVIPRQGNRDWRQDARRKQGKNLLPAEELARREGRALEGDEELKEEKLEFGLLVASNGDGTEDVVMKEGDGTEVITAVPAKVRTADEEALEALLSGGKKESTLVIPNAAAPTEERFVPKATSGDAFKDDVASRPDQAWGVPIEDFGTALLRGMGWKDGEALGKKRGVIQPKPKELKANKAQVGLGAKGVPEGEELGAWGKGAKKAGGRIDRNYMPVVAKNKLTGEMLTEEELQKRRDNEKILVDEGGRADDRRQRIEDGTRGGDKNGESSRHGSSRKERERSRSPKRRSDRDRDEGRDRRRREDGYEGRRDTRDKDRGHRSRDHESESRHRDRRDRDDRRSDGRRERYDDHGSTRHRDRAR